MIIGKTALYGVMGHPIAHSLSPRLHNKWYQEFALDAVYVPFDVKPENLERAVQGLRALNCQGWNVTVPHKETIMRYLDDIDPEAHTIGAVNTVVADHGKLIGYNTDARGYVASIEPYITSPWSECKALILGAGGAAKAVAYGLSTQGVRHLTVTNRTFEKSVKMQHEMPFIDIVSWEERHGILSHVNLVVNCTSVGLHNDDTRLLDVQLLPRDAVVSDLIYNPARTPLLAYAEQYNYRVVNGLGMLIHQAALAFELWFQRRPNVSRETISEIEKN
jgi:shikimate dehydrogenase